MANFKPSQKLTDLIKKTRGNKEKAARKVRKYRRIKPKAGGRPCEKGSGIKRNNKQIR